VPTWGKLGRGVSAIVRVATIERVATIYLLVLLSAELEWLVISGVPYRLSDTPYPWGGTGLTLVVWSAAAGTAFVD
jgi:hypothetical protein